MNGPKMMNLSGALFKLLGKTVIVEISDYGLIRGQVVWSGSDYLELSGDRFIPFSNIQLVAVEKEKRVETMLEMTEALRWIDLSPGEAETLKRSIDEAQGKADDE